MLLALCGSVHAHGRFIFSPGGGRILAIDSVSTPNAEFKVSADRRFEITFLDKDRKPIAIGERKRVVTAGDRSAAKKLSVEAKGAAARIRDSTKFLSSHSILMPGGMSRRSFASRDGLCG